MEVPAFEHRLGDHAAAAGKRHQRHHLRLHVGRKAWIGQGLHIHRPGLSVGSHLDRLLFDLERHPGFLELGEQGIAVVGPASDHAHLAARDGPRDQIRARLDTVRDDLVVGPVQLRHAFDRDDIRAGP